MTNRRVGHALLFLAIGLGILLLAAPAARADSDVRIVRLSYVNGDVQMDRGTGQGFERAVMNMPVTRGSRIWAGDDGYAEVEFEEGSTARLTPDSQINVLELSLRDDGGRVSLIEVQQGTAYFDIQPSGADDFRVTVAGHDLQVAHHTRFRVSGDESAVRVAVFAGKLIVPSGDSSIEVGKNQTLTLDLSDPNRYEVAHNVAEEPYDQWDHDRANYRDTYQASGNYNPGYSPAYSYGVSDLNYWGSYNYIDNWGWMWQPYFTYAGWNPWLDGAWVWYPGMGYMWVSAYPWGWMPYRYGGWYFISGYGWCWRPQRTWQHWAAVAPVYNPPPQFSPPRPPAAGSPAVVSVGRGPLPIIPNPQGPNWHGPRRLLSEPGAPGAPVRFAGGVQPVVMPHSHAPVPAGGSGTPTTVSVPAKPIRPVTPIPMRPPVEGTTPSSPATGIAQPAQPAGPAPAVGAGTYKPQPVHPVTPIPMRTDDEGRSFHGSGAATPTHTSSPPASTPPPPPASSGPAQPGGGHVSGGSGGSHSTPTPPSSPHSSSSPRSGWSGSSGSQFSGGSSGGGSHTSSSHPSSSSSGSRSPK